MKNIFHFISVFFGNSVYVTISCLGLTGERITFTRISKKENLDGIAILEYGNHDKSFMSVKDFFNDLICNNKNTIDPFVVLAFYFTKLFITSEVEQLSNGYYSIKEQGINGEKIIQEKEYLSILLERAKNETYKLLSHIDQNTQKPIEDNSRVSSISCVDDICYFISDTRIEEEKKEEEEETLDDLVSIIPDPPTPNSLKDKLKKEGYTPSAIVSKEESEKLLENIDELLDDPKAEEKLPEEIEIDPAEFIGNIEENTETEDFSFEDELPEKIPEEIPEELPEEIPEKLPKKTGLFKKANDLSKQ